ncbi:MAG TPA: hypothetical protein PKW37_01860 [Salinivirgaceae bacterium]|nr:hypothetical protein [Salinivirgaceae bacterium]
MRRSLLTTIVLTLVAVYGYGQKQCDIINLYEDFISVQKATHDGNDYITKSIVETTKESCISELVNSNTMFIDYLLTNFSSNANYQELLALTDSISIKKKYFEDLKKDTSFNSVMTDLVSKAVDKNIPKDTVTIDQLLNVAVKFFSIIRLNDEGHYIGKVCVGLNDIKKTESVRQPFLEAFSFSSIAKHYHSDEYSMYTEFANTIRELYKVNLGLDRGEKLLRAQGAVFLLMKNNESMQNMLKSEYEKQKEYLPFILVEE